MIKKYFASANSYEGFCSLFPEVYNHEFDRIFVLKGGPGTGKSTLMKKVYERVLLLDPEIELYYCSSDINSLDGLAINLRGKKIAIIDGTAPHERDAVYVGAIDELVNLGDSIDSTWIASYRDNIVELASQKSKAYKTAYSYLRLAGKCDEEIRRVLKNKFDRISADKYIRDFKINDAQNDTYSVRRRFVSSFSKDGYKSFDVEKNEGSNILRVGGDRCFAHLLLNYIKDSFQLYDRLEFLSPLCPKFLDGIKICDKLMVYYDENNYVVDSREFSSVSKLDIEETKLILSSHEEFLAEATRWFKIASDIHFRLEDIYKKCVNFEKNDSIIEDICKKILKLCDCEY